MYSSFELKTIAPVELPPLFLAIENLMRQAEPIAGQTAEEHWRAFLAQMREKFGVDEIALDEPYLPQTLAASSLKFLIKLEQLMQKLERSAEDEHSPAVIFDPDQPLLPQLNQRLELETVHYRMALKQELDKTRQQSFGVKKYVWRASSTACNICGPLDGQIFTWGGSDAPGETHPNCQCWAEPVPDGAGEPSKPDIKKLLLEIANLLILMHPAGRGGRIGREIVRRATRDEAPTQKPPEKPPAQPLPKPDKVPKDWNKVPSQKGEGVKYVDPKNSGNSVRIQRGEPNAKWPSQRKDYVRWEKNGQALDKNGNPVPKNSAEAHIPLEDFKFGSELFK